MDFGDDFFEEKIKDEEKASKIADLDDDEKRLLLSRLSKEPKTLQFGKSKQLTNNQSTNDLNLKTNDNKPNNIEAKNPNNDPIFDMLKLPAVFAMVGAPKSGKTHAMKHLNIHFLKNGDLQFGMVMTGTKFSNQFDFIQDNNMIISGYDGSVLKSYLRKLKEYRLKNNKPAKAFLVFDDMVGQIPFESELILHLFTTYRWYGLTIFISTQYIYKINPTIRTVADYAFIWAQDNKRCYDAVYETFGLMFDDYNEFRHTLDSITSEQYACLFYNKDKRSKNERYNGYKAPPEIPDLKFQFNKPKDSSEQQKPRFKGGYIDLL